MLSRENDTKCQIKKECVNLLITECMSEKKFTIIYK